MFLEKLHYVSYLYNIQASCKTKKKIWLKKAGPKYCKFTTHDFNLLKWMFL